MSIFWLNNIHFALEFFGATALVVAAWLAVDAYALTREKKALLKVFGFALIAAWQVIHALDATTEGLLLIGIGALIGGAGCMFLNLYLEAPPARPKSFELVFVIPGAAGLLGHFFTIAGFLTLGAAAVAFRRYRGELNKPLKPIWLGFGFLAASFFAGAVSARHLVPDAWWFVEHALRMVGFIALTVWVWQYLSLRLKEQLLLVFVAMSLLVSLVVTFTFSALLLARMRADATQSLKANARVFSYALGERIETAQSKARLAALDPKLMEATLARDFGAMEDRVKSLREDLGVDFVTLVEQASGEVVVRATYRTVRGEKASADSVIAGALEGRNTGDIVAAAPEGLSIRGASTVLLNPPPIVGEGFVRSLPPVPGSYIVEVGFLLDPIFLDNFKKLTGLDATVFAGDLLHASTIVDIDGKTQPVGVRLTDPALRDVVFTKQKAFTGSATFLGKPHLASYLPLQNSLGTLVGIVAASRPEVEISKAAIATNRLTLFTTLLIVLALLLPAYFVVRSITEEA